MLIRHKWLTVVRLALATFKVGYVVCFSVFWNNILFYWNWLLYCTVGRARQTTWRRWVCALKHNWRLCWSVIHGHKWCFFCVIKILLCARIRGCSFSNFVSDPSILSKVLSITILLINTCRGQGYLGVSLLLSVVVVWLSCSIKTVISLCLELRWWKWHCICRSGCAWA